MPASGHDWSIGPLGVWVAVFDDWTGAEIFEALAELERTAYSAVWVHEALGREVLSLAGALLARTRSLTIATGIANVWARDAMAMANAGRSLAELSDGRLVLGLGISHAPLVEDVRGHAYARPLAKMREYLTAMDAAAYHGVSCERGTPRVIGALAPKMLALAAEFADGAHTYLVTPGHTRQAREILGPGKLLAVEQTVVLSADASQGLATARNWISQLYLSLPNYLESFRRQGFEASDLAGGGSDRLLRSVIAIGTPDEICERVREHFAAGADHVCIQVMGASNGASGRRAWREFEAPLAAVAAELGA